MRSSLLILVALACSGPAPRDAAWERHAAALAGQWNVRFDYGSGQSARGSMELSVNRTVNAAHPWIGVPTNYGTYAVEFRALGGSPSGDRVPAVVAGVANDSVLVSFETDREGFSMQMRAALSSDSIRGVWLAAQSRGTIASGTFLMTRP